jgi:hypothetical protein
MADIRQPNSFADQHRFRPRVRGAEGEARTDASNGQMRSIRHGSNEMVLFRTLI